ncbi:ABC transporter ATP-binding protein [Aeribacillus sp. FSL K6-8210]|jgi:lantibiotic transport system ATP-binding protein|uniref:ABC transporter ATP-binding protein n=1 Tax=Aeribacillus sp. FSL K6-8210 TaxID=2954683 RepID=UPI0030CE0955
MDVINTSHLTRKYGKQYAVKNVNLNVKEGSIYGFLGPNGAGKSTTIRMLLGLIKPTKGSVKIFGKDLAKHRMEILSKVGSLVETPSYYGHLTGYENLEAARRLLGVPEKRIAEVLNIVRLTKAADKKVKQYSLGMKQRLGIATALLVQPKLLILDEPTNGLDPAGIQEIRELIKTMPKQHNMTIIVSSHLLSEIEQMADQVGIINKGELIFQDSINVLKEKSKPALHIGVEQAEKAVAFLKEQGYYAKLAGTRLVMEDTDPELVGKINYALVSEGFWVYRLEEVKRSLEDIFIELTGVGESV